MDNYEQPSRRPLRPSETEDVAVKVRVHGRVRETLTFDLMRFFFFLQILEDTWFVGWTLKWVGWLVGWIGSCVVGYLISWSLFFFFSVCTIYLVVSWNSLVVLLVKCFLQVWSTDESIIWIYFCFISLPSRSCRERSFWEQSDEVCVHFTDWLWTDV